MERNQVYLTGYLLHTPDDIARWARETGGTVIDIRWQPNSRKPEWRQPALKAMLGTAYRWIASFGNPRHKDGVLEVCDMEVGIWTLQRALGPYLLMCACRDPEKCHRSLIRAALEERGYQCDELSRVRSEVGEATGHNTRELPQQRLQ